MMLHYLVVALLTLLSHGAAAHDHGPNVGIYLSSGYATVSARFTDGSFLDIAKIEGDKAYKAYMLDPNSDGLWAPSYCPFPREWCYQYWPFQHVRSDKPIVSMLASLVSAAESALKTSINAVTVSGFGGATSNKGSGRDVRVALKKMGIYAWKRSHVAQHLVSALDIGGRCSEHPSSIARGYVGDDADPPTFVMTVEFNRHSITAALWKERCGRLQAPGYLNSNELGHDSLLACRSDAKKSDKCDDTLKAALSRVARKDSDYVGPKYLDHLLVFGELGEHDDVMMPLRQVLQTHFVNAEVPVNQARDLGTDLTFAASRALAYEEVPFWDTLGNRGYTRRNEL